MLRLGVIQPSQSYWASPVVVVPKKNGKPRFFVAYRLLNAVTKKVTYPVPQIDHFLDSLGEVRFFSTLDCTAGYLQINIRGEDREKTAFVCHSGLFEWLRIPCGLTNSPATFQRALDVNLTWLKWKICLVYLDDVIVFSKTAEEHIQHLDTVLTRLREAGVALNLEKCSLFKTEVEYLGHIVSPGMLRVRNRNTEALRRATYPTTDDEFSGGVQRLPAVRQALRQTGEAPYDFDEKRGPHGPPAADGRPAGGVRGPQGGVDVAAGVAPRPPGPPFRRRNGRARRPTGLRPPSGGRRGQPRPGGFLQPHPPIGGAELLYHREGVPRLGLGRSDSPALPGGEPVYCPDGLPGLTVNL